MKRFVHGSIRRVGNRLHGKWMPFVLLSRRSARRRLRVGSGKIVSRDTDVDSDGRSVCVGNTEIAQGRNGLFRFRGLADDVAPGRSRQAFARGARAPRSHRRPDKLPLLYGAGWLTRTVRVNLGNAKRRRSPPKGCRTRLSSRLSQGCHFGCQGCHFRISRAARCCRIMFIGRGCCGFGLLC